MSNDSNEGTLRQATHLLKILGDKSVTKQRLDSLIETGLLSDLLDAEDLKKVSRNEFRKFLGLQSFSLVADFGVITVPEGYDSLSALSLFDGSDDLQKTGNSFIFMQGGDRFNVKAFTNTLDYPTTDLDSRLNFLKIQKGILLGEHGAVLVAQQKKDLLSVQGVHSYDSVDQHHRLYVDHNNHPRIPSVNKFGNLYFSFFDHYMYKTGAFLCFTKVKD
jgi:hypothetical protein